ncbi:MAG: hypothetical protein ABJE95_01955 [Byssovorax sp.]
MTLLPALNPLRCRHADCTLPEDGRCARAAEYSDPELECPELFRAEGGSSSTTSPAPAQVASEPEPDDDEATPWKGRHLSLTEAEEIVQRSPARLISVLGSYGAGKTSLMASFFLQIANGHYGNFPYCFASSRTLYGFQDLIERANRWTGKPNEQIVDHTPRDESSQTGSFLHVGLRPRDERDDRHIDLLLTDVAGEWIDSWTRRADEDAKRRLAFIPRSDGFIVVVDAFELFGNDGMKMDTDIGRLIRRVVRSAGARRGRTLAVVFSKFDTIIDQVEVPEQSAASERSAWGRLGKLTPGIWAAINHARAAGFETSQFAVSAFPRPLAKGQPAGVMAPFTFVMGAADRRERWARVVVPIPQGATPFQAMRRQEAGS